VEEVGFVEIDPEDIRGMQYIASGSFGDVYRATWQGKDVAVKKLRGVMVDPKAFSGDVGIGERMKILRQHKFFREVEVLSRINHPSIMRLYGAVTKEVPIMLVSEFVGGGDLFQKIHQSLYAPTYLECITFALELAEGLEHMHGLEPKIIHRDIKPPNLLITEDGHLKLSDFGLARLLSDVSDLTSQTGTYRWMAPEVIRNAQYNEKADIYSFGVLLWELITGMVPYGEQRTDTKIAVMVADKGHRPTAPASAAPELKTLMQECWAEDASTRPPATEIVRILRVERDKIVAEMEASKAKKQCCVVM